MHVAGWRAHSGQLVRASCIMLAKVVIAVTPTLRQYIFILHFNPKYFVTVPVSGRADLDRGDIMGCVSVSH